MDRTSRALSIATLVAALTVACSEGTAPGHRGPTPPPNAIDVAGTYALSSVNGTALPTLPLGATSAADTVYGGCLVLGQVAASVQTSGDSSWTILTGSANESWFFTKSEADRAVVDPTYCPPFLSGDGGSRYTIAGDSGEVSSCGPHACIRIPFIVAVSGPSRTLRLLRANGTEVFTSR